MRGLNFCNQLVDRYNFHRFDDIGPQVNNKKDPRREKVTNPSEMTVQTLMAASAGDINFLKRLKVYMLDGILVWYA